MTSRLMISGAAWVSVHVPSISAQEIDDVLAALSAFKLREGSV